MSYRVCSANRHGKFHFFLFICSLFTSYFLLFAPSRAYSGEWRVLPIRLQFDRGTRSGVISVQNEGDTPLNVQVTAMGWTQDAEGKDQYADTSDLILFPKLLLIPPKEERVIRVGNRGVAGAREKTYRLFIEELPPPRKASETTGTTVAIAVRFAVPLFISPVKDELSGELMKTELYKGNLSVTVKNRGNVHFRLTNLDIKGRTAKGEETFTQRLDGWYLLNGTTRAFLAQIPAEACMKTEIIEVEGAAEQKISLKGRLAVDKTQCMP